MIPVIHLASLGLHLSWQEAYFLEVRESRGAVHWKIMV